MIRLCQSFVDRLWGKDGSKYDSCGMLVMVGGDDNGDDHDDEHVMTAMLKNEKHGAETIQNNRKMHRSSKRLENSLNMTSLTWIC